MKTPEQLKGKPFDLGLPVAKPVAIGSMSRAQLDAELAKGMDSLHEGTTYTPDQVDAELAREFDI
jgi:hypothetical protein